MAALQFRDRKPRRHDFMSKTQRHPQSGDVTSVACHQQLGMRGHSVSFPLSALMGKLGGRWVFESHRRRERREHRARREPLIHADGR